MKTRLWTLALVVALSLSVSRGAPLAEDVALIPGGPFVKGTTFSEGNPDERPTNVVDVSAFYMDRTDVTKGLWDEVFLWAVNHGYDFNSPAGGKTPTHPIHSVSWFDAVKWCNARSEMAGLKPAYYTDATQTAVYRRGYVDLENDWVNWNAGYRLPTEAEWEKAARGGVAGRRFPWPDVDTITHARANYTADPSTYPYDANSAHGLNPTFATDGAPYTSPVAYFAPNGYGLHDMAGNVWQWCWDRYDASYYASSPSADPRGPTTGQERVGRGGSWDHHAWDCRAATRNKGTPDYSGINLGFRCVRNPTDWRHAGTVSAPPPSQPIYSCLPPKEFGKDSLVVITHGRIRRRLGESLPPDQPWVDTMVNNIRNSLTMRGLTNWQVAPYKWLENAWTRFLNLPIGSPLGPDESLLNAVEEGIALGRCIETQGWNHVHLIGHSAGAALIQSATSMLPPTTTIHTTFLDAYVGGAGSWRSAYGLGSTWSDSYFTHDLETSGNVGAWTEGSLDRSYNVEVTWLDENRILKHKFCSENLQPCLETVSSHGWPIDFYQATITNESFGEGHGFRLSKEGGNWDYATNRYLVGNKPPHVLGTTDAPCFPCPENLTSIPVYMNSALNLDDLSFLRSSTGLSEVKGAACILTTESPVWLAIGLPVTNAINQIAFDAGFTSNSGAEGLLSVFWNTIMIGVVDERVSVAGIRRYSFPLPARFSSGNHVLGFRLDPFTATASTIMMTNIVTGFTGIAEPFALNVATTLTNGMRLLTLIGPPAYSYVVEASTNLVDWTPVATLVNSSGSVSFFDATARNFDSRFYRLVGP